MYLTWHPCTRSVFIFSAEVTTAYFKRCLHASFALFNSSHTDGRRSVSRVSDGQTIRFSETASQGKFLKKAARDD